MLQARTVSVSLGVGVLATLISCLAPALRATRIPPVVALREGVALPESKSSRLAFGLALVLSCLGVAAIAVGLFGGLDDSPALLLVGTGAGATFLGIALLSPPWSVRSPPSSGGLSRPSSGSRAGWRARTPYEDSRSGQVDQALVLVYALLALTVLVAVFGIVNTLVLSVTERTRELGMLRAIGSSRRQVRRVIRYEAVITAQIGGVLGIALGVLLALLVSRAIEDFSLSIPYPTLAALFGAAAFAGVAAAVLPARRASRLNVLDALGYE